MIAERGVTIKIYDSTTDGYIYIQPKDVKDVEIVQECDKVSKNIPESYGTVVINASEGLLEKLLLKTEFEIYYDGVSKIKLFIEKVRHKDADSIEIKGKDLFFIYDFLKTSTFHWIQAPEDYFYKNAYEVFDAFLTECGVPYEIDEGVKDLKINGVIENDKLFIDVLNALLFASGARVVAGDKFYIRPLVGQNIKIINSNRIIGSATINTQQREGISLMVPYEDYAPIETKFKTGKNLDTTSAAYGTWEDGDTKYGKTHYNKNTHQIIVTMREKYNGEFYAWDMVSDVIIETKNVGNSEYRFTQNELTDVVREKYLFSAYLPDPDTLKPPYERDYNEIVVFIGRFGEKTTGEYKITSDNPYATLQTVAKLTTINSNNVEEVASRLYNDDINTEEIKCKIAERKIVHEGNPYTYGERLYGQGVHGQLKASSIDTDEPIYVGDIVQIDLGKSGVFTKVVTKQRYNLNGGIIVKDTTLK